MAAAPFLFSARAQTGATPGTNAPVEGSSALNLAGLLAEELRANGLPAIAAAAMKRGAVVAAAATGIRKVGDAAKVTIADKFHLGSCTKAMTATLAAILVERGKIRWDDTLAKIFPECAGNMLEAYRKVTLPMLLTHRAGVPAGGKYGSSQSTLVSQRFNLMDSTLRLPLTSVPGTVTAYTNIGYIIAGAVLERVTGKPWEELMRENLFQPLGLKSAGFGPPSKPGQVDQPWGHAFKAGKYEPNRADNPPALGPAGTVHCGLLDYLKFAELHTSLGSRGPQVLRPVSIAQLHEPPKGTDYAFGWSVRRPAWAQGPAFSHTGSNTNNHFLVWAAPKVDLCMAVATNSSTFEKDGNGKWFGQEKIEKVLYAVAAKIAGHFAG